MLRRVLRPQLSFAIGCIMLAGCGGKSGPPAKIVTGKVLENDKPVAIQPYRQGYNFIEVEFFSIDDAGKTAAAGYIAPVAEDGSFKLVGDEGKGIPLKKYKIAVRRVDRTTNARPEPTGRMDAWKGKYGPDKSPFTLDVNSSQQLTIDLAKAAGTPPSKP